MQVLLNSWEILVEELFCNKIWLQMQCKRSSSQIVFKDFACPLGTAKLRNNYFLLTA